jgi:hypothetical protein
MHRYERTGSEQDLRDFRLWFSYFNSYKLIVGVTDKGMIEESERIFQDKPHVYEDYDRLLKSHLRSQCLLLKEANRFTPQGLGTSLKPVATSVSISPGVTGTTRDYLEINSGKFIPVLPFGFLTSLTDDEFITRIRNIARIKSDFCGNIHYLEGPGLKTRAILIPDLIVQSKLKPIQEDLMNLLRSSGTDCTYDQDSGVNFILDKMAQGDTLYSVDLSAATWNFSSDCQQEVLTSLGYEADVISLMFHLPVYDRISGRTSTINKGQGMGLAPSFPLFALTHNLVLSALCKILGLIPKDSFRVLGDDIVLANGELHKLYTDWCSMYEMPISETKTMISRDIAEFAGKIIWKGKDISPLNWKIPTLESMSQLHPAYRSISKKIWKYIQFKDPLINRAWEVLKGLPSELGGINDTSPVPVHVQKIRTTWIRSAIAAIQNPQVAFGRHVVSTFGITNSTYEQKGQLAKGYPPFYRALASFLIAELPKTYWSQFYQWTDVGQFLNQLQIKAALIPFRRNNTSGIDFFEKRMKPDLDADFSKYLNEYFTCKTEIASG